MSGAAAARDGEVRPTDEINLSSEDEQYIEEVIGKLQEAKNEMGRAVKGQEELIENTLIALMCSGHILLEGLPGLAKTVLAESVASVMGLSENRVNGTPDLMPSDIIGTEILEEDKGTGKRTMRFEEGPIFTNVFLFDEGNRASPRTQSGALQAMQEKKVTVGGKTYKLPDVFFMLMTQNPIEQEGTNPLPEAQKDRFILQQIISYPDRDSEGEVGLKTTTTHHSISEIRDRSKKLEPPQNMIVKPSELNSVFDEDEIVRVQHLVRALPIGQTVYDAILDVVRNARPNLDQELEDASLSETFNFVSDNVEFGPGTRAVQAMMLSVRARALMHGRIRANLDDVVAMSDPVLRHRMGLTIAASANKLDERDVIDQLVKPFKNEPLM